MLAPPPPGLGSISVATRTVGPRGQPRRTRTGSISSITARCPDGRCLVNWPWPWSTRSEPSLWRNCEDAMLQFHATTVEAFVGEFDILVVHFDDGQDQYLQLNV